MSLITFLDYASVIVFAITGALVASRAQLDLVGFAFIACLTAVGGGTIRDLLLDRNPIFWIAEPTYLAAAATAALVIFFTATCSNPACARSSGSTASLWPWPSPRVPPSP